MAINRFLKDLGQIRIKSILFLLITVSSIANSAQYDWQLARSSDTIKIYKAQTKDSNFAHVRAELTTYSSLSGFLLFLQDYKNIPNWLDNANNALLIRQITPSRNLFVTHFDGIWPVKPRNMVIETEYIQQPNLSIDIYVQDASDKTEQFQNSIRIKVQHAHWHIAPQQEQGLIKINYQFNVDPKGSAPSWLVNKMTISSVWNTMQKIEQLLPNSPWQNFHITHIEEPK
ncbi:hypothetical protein HII17_12790 [Thalassotalea sp. M1531]|uniref:START domain-containing protein n=1 Tax=Thalassotalea algicola TaxID=2716224 RepID=A0A7Y0LDH8_9GAMM|nr:START domain-containing protein [Thalassotalea algicola]NMP32441.1 hypothetical protein [Thalassotalea algicola]